MRWNFHFNKYWTPIQYAKCDARHFYICFLIDCHKGYRACPWSITCSPPSAFYSAFWVPKWPESTFRACMSHFPEFSFWMVDCTKGCVILAWKNSQVLFVKGMEWAWTYSLECPSLGTQGSILCRTELGVRIENRPSAKSFHVHSCHDPQMWGVGPEAFLIFAPLFSI